MNSTDSRAVGAQLECNVRPALWATHLEDDAELMSDADKVGMKLGCGIFDVPLYDQAALDAAVTAERERCAKLCEDDAKQRHAEALPNIGSNTDLAVTWFAGANASTTCAARIRGPNVPVKRGRPASA